ncbi:hypothetical protein TWF569_001160 [Orbilia oligospora]|nr:hypothetical protein TWF706_009710 [Orbilia oligospora]KAF3124872.1 hypothetical protein TWF569_001160 [Orbilia oligospora]KAF3127984.1 hypothetical protein TWF594_011837 [Orbilia oligospora]
MSITTRRRVPEGRLSADCPGEDLRVIIGFTNAEKLSYPKWLDAGSLQVNNTYKKYTTEIRRGTESKRQLQASGSCPDRDSRIWKTTLGGRIGSGLGLTEVQDRNGCEGVEQEGGSVSDTCTIHPYIPSVFRLLENYNKYGVRTGQTLQDNPFDGRKFNYKASARSVVKLVVE